MQSLNLTDKHNHFVGVFLLLLSGLWPCWYCCNYSNWRCLWCFKTEVSWQCKDSHDEARGERAFQIDFFWICQVSTRPFGTACVKGTEVNLGSPTEDAVSVRNAWAGDPCVYTVSVDIISVEGFSLLGLFQGWMANCSCSPQLQLWPWPYIGFVNNVSLWGFTVCFHSLLLLAACAVWRCYCNLLIFPTLIVG